jgi:hypothetical protein
VRQSVLVEWKLRAILTDKTIIITIDYLWNHDLYGAAEDVEAGCEENWNHNNQ